MLFRENCLPVKVKDETFFRKDVTLALFLIKVSPFEMKGDIFWRRCHLVLVYTKKTVAPTQK